VRAMGEGLGALGPRKCFFSTHLIHLGFLKRRLRRCLIMFLCELSYCGSTHRKTAIVWRLNYRNRAGGASSSLQFAGLEQRLADLEAIVSPKGK